MLDILKILQYLEWNINCQIASLRSFISYISLAKLWKELLFLLLLVNFLIRELTLSSTSISASELVSECSHVILKLKAMFHTNISIISEDLFGFEPMWHLVGKVVDTQCTCISHINVLILKQVCNYLKLYMYTCTSMH